MPTDVSIQYDNAQAELERLYETMAQCAWCGRTVLTDHLQKVEDYLVCPWCWKVGERV